MTRLPLSFAIATFILTSAASAQSIAPPSTCSIPEMVTYGRAIADSVMVQGKYFLTAENAVQTTAVLASIMSQTDKMVGAYTKCGYPPNYAFAWPTTTPDPTPVRELDTVTIETFASDSNGINAELKQLIQPSGDQPPDANLVLREAATQAEYLEYVLAEYTLHPNKVIY